MSATNKPNKKKRLVQSAALSTLNSLLIITLNMPSASTHSNVIPECLHHFCDTFVSRRVFKDVANSFLFAELGSPAGEI